MLGGKCRFCKAKISAQYPIIEGVNGILYVVICVVNGLNVVSFVYCLMGSALIVLSVIDWRTFEIPFGINVFLFVLGVVATGLDGMSGLAGHLIGMVCVSGVLGMIYLVSGGAAIGGGDVKIDVCLWADFGMAEDFAGFSGWLYCGFGGSYDPH